ncbi:NAD(P)H dehydrogenase (quinone) [Rhodovastum atsumiense]|uniref:NAD(P)H:quinone oxidoreductase n=1 Tax=Rhodovastum atsumiense TaxID=504468 RepID=A0A5M6IT39_9PROT|nr:NAD(P)H:quinone oxidoreductase [Rhodovastum atsumiense]KAA5610728.1 NAD(P)H:quinone oxidoreductase [Rhodovastum atsumiense]CAH2604350.1 NAD(P)H dehydrogenase (quinone) [Rhodovastum atsumiense]
MTNVLIAFYSRSGTIESLAAAAAEGARSEGAEVRLRRVRELVSDEVMTRVPGWHETAQRMNAAYEAPSAEDAVWADAVILGTPTRFGCVSSELKSWIDSLGGLWAAGKLVGKVGSVLSSTASLHGGNEATILSLWPPLAHLGFIIVPTGYADPAMTKAGTPYGATAAVGQSPRPITEDERAAARWQGCRVTRVATALRG